MAELHELIAVEKQIRNTTIAILEETRQTFAKRADHFDGRNVQYVALNEEDKDIVEEEYKEVVTTVAEKLTYTEKQVKKYLDFIYTKEKANTCASGDIIIEGEGDSNLTISEIPVTVLIQWEKRFEEFKKACEVIPTLEPKISWIKDPENLTMWKQAREIKKPRTKKKQVPITLALATKEHPEQAQLISKDILVGHYTHNSKTGRYSPLQKSILLERIDLVIRSIKRARSRANKQSVKMQKISQKLFEFIHKEI